MNRRARLLFVLALGGAVAAAMRPLGAQQPHAAADPLAAVRRSLPAAPDSARAALSALLWQTIADAERSEFVLAQELDRMESDSASAAASEALYGEVAERRELLVALLDTLVLATAWGPDELQRLRRRYPSSPLFLRYEARLASQRGEHDAALDAYTRLLARRPADAELHTDRARELVALGRTDEAIAAYTRALEVEPGNEPVFRSLVRLREQNRTLPALLTQLRRLRTLYPGVPALADHEIEILHRLGRLGEASEVARPPRKDTP